MKIQSINKQSDCYGMHPLKGWEDAIMSPASRKKIVYNDNASMNGSRAITTHRMVDKRSFNIQFLIKGSKNELERYQKMAEIEESLTKGMDSTGVNEIAVTIDGKVITFFAIMETMDKYQGFGKDKAIVSIKFTELNPKNRLVV